MNARGRKALGCAVLLAYLALYTICAASLGAALAPSTPAWLMIFYYAFAGIAWVLPLKPLFDWMRENDSGA